MIRGTGNNGYIWILLKWNIFHLLITLCSAQYQNRTATTCTYDSVLFNPAGSPNRGFLRLDCEPDDSAPQVIHILNAIYGVSLYSTCTHNPGDTCKVDGSHFEHIRECNGKRNCKIPTYSMDLECPGGGDTMKSHYLQVEFQCVPGTLHPEEDSICGGYVYPDENYEDPEEENSDVPERRRRRDASLPEDDLPHIEHAHYRVTFPAAFLTSPNYPHNYPNYMHCECYLQTHNDAYIIFRVLDFEIEHGQSCMYDYLQMSIGPLSERFCDIVPRETMVRTQTNFVHLQMESDDSVSSTGVWTEYWGQKTDGTRVPVRSKCGRFSGSTVPENIPPFPPENTGVSVSVSRPTRPPTPNPPVQPPRPPKPPPPTPRRPTPPRTSVPVGQRPQGSNTTPRTETTSPESSPKSSDSTGGLNMSIIIGAAAGGGLLILILIIVAVVMCCRRRAAGRALKSRPGISRSISSLSGHLPPAPNVPAPKIPTGPFKGQEYVGLNGDHVSYKSPPGSSYTTLDSKSNLHGIKVLPDPLHMQVPTAPPYTQYPNNVPTFGGHPTGFVNPDYTDNQDEHIYAEIYDEITKFSRDTEGDYENEPKNFANNTFTKGAMSTSNSYNNFLNTGAQTDKIHVGIINGNNRESHDYHQSYLPQSHHQS